MPDYVSAEMAALDVLNDLGQALAHRLPDLVWGASSRQRRRGFGFYASLGARVPALSPHEALEVVLATAKAADEGYVLSVHCDFSDGEPGLDFESQHLGGEPTDRGLDDAITNARAQLMAKLDEMVAILDSPH